MKYKGTLVVVKNCAKALCFYKNVLELMTHNWGQKVVRFYDPDGNLIEVGTPA